MMEKRWIRWLLAIAGWTSVAFFFASQTYLTYKSSGGSAPIGLILKVSLGEWYVWALLAPGIVWLAKRVPLEREHWARSTAIHLGASVACVFGVWGLANLERHLLLGLPNSVRLVYVFHQNLIIYWLLVAATMGYRYYWRYREGELRTAQLSAQLAQAQLQALRMQLHPHFLFNTLNAISTLVHDEFLCAAKVLNLRIIELQLGTSPYQWNSRWTRRAVLQAEVVSSIVGYGPSRRSKRHAGFLPWVNQGASLMGHHGYSKMLLPRTCVRNSYLETLPITNWHSLLVITDCRTSCKRIRLSRSIGQAIEISHCTPDLRG